jgi:AraC-like DNA-binding protein
MCAALAERDLDALTEREHVPLALVPRRPAPALRGVARDLCGYVEETGAPLRRRELPSADIIFIVNLGAPLLVEQPAAPPRIVPTGGGFIAGLHETYSQTETAGSQSGLEMRLSPLGAYRLCGQPMHALANRSLALDELFGRWASDLGDHLQHLPTWEARFAAVETAFSQRLAGGPAPSPEVAWAWRQLARSGGGVAIATLAAELGWSPKRLIGRFREQVGLPPKQVARLLRFQRASEMISAAADWRVVAQQCGYYDQAHLINEFRQFSGDTPHGLARRRLAAGGFAADAP